MSDLISREAALDAVKFKTIDDGGVVDDCIMQVLALAKSKVNKLPAVDAVEVVRCKDCKHWREESLWCNMNSKDRGEHYNWYAEDFCSYGEKRGESND